MATNQTKGLNGLIARFFHAPDGNRSNLQTILWWESRRIPYNFFVGTTGIGSLLLFFMFITKTGTLAPGEDAIEPMALFAAPILINVFYTFGWIVELALKYFLGIKHTYGPKLLKAGFGFSFAVVLFPSLFWGGYLFFQWIGIIHSSVH